MARRRYEEEDSLIEDFEESPLHRAPRLHSGQGPSKRRDDRRHSTLKRHPDEDRINFIMDLCDDHHTFEPTSAWQMLHRCKACNSVRTKSLVQCIQCRMCVHTRCQNDPNKKIPLPCIPETPIKNIKKPDLQDCLANLPDRYPKVPAILIKCFHELQKKGRITTADMYVPLSQAGDEIAAIKKLSTKLRQHVNRSLDNVSTQTIGGCVLLFLHDIRDQLITEGERAQFGLDHARCFVQADRQVRGEVCAALQKFDLHRLHTLAAVFMHIHDVYGHKEQNNMDIERIHEVFGEVFENIELLLTVPLGFWRSRISSFRRLRVPKVNEPVGVEEELIENQ